jgi:hypothetical protein
LNSFDDNDRTFDSGYAEDFLSTEFSNFIHSFA